MVSDLTWAQRKRLSQIREHAEHLDEILGNALDKAAIDEGSMRLRKVNFSLRESLRDLLATYSQQARHQNRRVSHYVQTRVPDSLLGDVEHFQHVILTLLERIGVESTPHDVELRVAVVSRDGDDVTLQVILSGGDIERAASEIALFVDDEQAPQISLNSVNASVMDLAISVAVQMIRVMGGRLRLVREPGQPMQIAFTATFEVSTRQSFGSTERTMLGLIPDLPVLLVHEDDTERADLDERLLAWQTEPTCVSDGKEMWRELEAARRSGNPFGLVILSNRLSGETGADLCRHLQQDPLHAATPRILFVEQNQEHAAQNASKAGVATLLTSPWTNSDLARTILSSVLGKGRFKQMRKGLGAAEMYVRSLIPLPTTEPLHIDWRYVPAADLAGDALG